MQLEEAHVHDRTILLFLHRCPVFLLRSTLLRAHFGWRRHGCQYGFVRYGDKFVKEAATRLWRCGRVARGGANGPNPCRLANCWHEFTRRKLRNVAHKSPLLPRLCPRRTHTCLSRCYRLHPPPPAQPASSSVDTARTGGPSSLELPPATLYSLRRSLDTPLANMTSMNFVTFNQDHSHLGVGKRPSLKPGPPVTDAHDPRHHQRISHLHHRSVQ